MQDGEALKWFRAPQGKYTSAMREVVKKHRFTHVLGDCYCDDFANKDSTWVASTLLRQVRPGSILIMHMPERGHWEHTLEAIRMVLQGLNERKLQSVTLSTLQHMAKNPSAQASSEARQQADSEGKDPDEPSSGSSAPLGRICKHNSRAWPVGCKEQRVLGDYGSEDQAYKAAVDAINADPSYCVVEVGELTVGRVVAQKSPTVVLYRTHCMKSRQQIMQNIEYPKRRKLPTCLCELLRGGRQDEL
eukprot:5599346-Amphidinium_carterae.2